MVSTRVCITIYTDVDRHMWKHTDVYKGNFASVYIDMYGCYRWYVDTDVWL